MSVGLHGEYFKASKEGWTIREEGLDVQSCP